MKKIGIICIGNPLRMDDGLGIILLQKLVKNKDKLPKNLEFLDAGTGGMNLLHLLVKFETVLIVDVVNINKKPGETRLIDPDEIISKRIPITISTHESDFLKVLQISKTLDEAPKNLYIFGIQPKELSYGGKLSTEIEKKLDTIFENLVFRIKKISEST